MNRPNPSSSAATVSDVVTVTTRKVSCDGGGALGHPLVYLDMGARDMVECGYCDRVFRLKK